MLKILEGIIKLFHFSRNNPRETLLISKYPTAVTQNDLFLLLQRETPETDGRPQEEKQILGNYTSVAQTNVER